MDLRSYAEIRDAAQRSRRAPRETPRLEAAFDGGGDLGEDVPLGPVELTIEATNAESELAPWLADEWWAELIQHWSDCTVTVHTAPTPGALLHPVLLYQLEMLRRVVPGWRLVGHAYADDVATDSGISEFVRSPYHEVRFMDQPRSGVGPSDRCSWTLSLDQLFGQIRQHQARLGSNTPILVRLPSTAKRSTPASQAERDKVAPPTAVKKTR